MSVSATLRDAYALGLGADHIINLWGLDENLPRLAEKAAEGAMAATVCAFYNEAGVPLMPKVVEYAKKFNPGVPQEKRLIRTVQAWSNVLALWEAMKRADKAGALNGEGILKKGFETMRDFDLGLGGAKLTYTDTDHRVSGAVPVYEVKDGKFRLVQVTDIKSRWPDKWASWLGW